MKTVVCIKQVPSSTDAKIDPETKRIIREGAKAVINPFDLYAVEEALRIRERIGGEVIVLTMGPDNAKNSLIEALSMGADKAFLLCDRAFAGSDTWATSYALAKAIEKIGNADLVICGKQAVDGDTAQVGPGIASKLDMLQAANVSAVEDITAGEITVSRMNETGYDVLKLKLPALITVTKDINEPRIPTLRNARKARTAEITVWKPDDIGADPDKIGLNASPTRVVRTEPPALRNTVTLKIEGEPSQAAKKLADELINRGLI
ncbi:MAG: electron transfer flavoprotein subunit beta/FixA family protein [Clostridia bacterium]|nr:electron transfer flavoprotein subunit beta/FixA family protein [Clostridia bacterium]